MANPDPIVVTTPASTARAAEYAAASIAKAEVAAAKESAVAESKSHPWVFAAAAFAAGVAVALLIDHLVHVIL